MDKKKTCVVFIGLLAGALAAQPLAQSSAIKFSSNAGDLAKIHNVLEEFRQDIIHKEIDGQWKILSVVWTRRPPG
jgi:hypothetical protein